MQYLKYYDREDKLYRDLLTTPLTVEHMIKATRFLLSVQELPPVAVTIGVGSYSYYQPPGDGKVEHINYLVSMLNPLTIVHEVAHLVHQKAKEARHRIAKASGRKPVQEKSHGVAFQRVVAKLAGQMRARLATR